MVLCAVQNLVKRKERDDQEDKQSESKRGEIHSKPPHLACLTLFRTALSKCVLILCVSLESDSEILEELLKPGHLSRLLEEDLSGDVSSLSLPEVNGVLTELLQRLRSHRDACKPHQLQVSRITYRPQ